MTTKVKLIGYEDLLRKMRAIPEVTKLRVQEVLADQADEIVDFATRLAPHKTGALRRSITWHWGKREGAPGATGSDVTTAKRPNFFGGELTVSIVAGSSEAFYVRWVEFGTVKMTKKPFFFPAYRASRASAKSAIRAATRAAAREVAAS